MLETKLNAISPFFDRQTVSSTLQRYFETGNFIDRERPGRPKLLSREHYVAIDNFMDKDNELTTPRLKECLLERFPDVTASERTIARAREELGWVHQTAKYAQLVREVNKSIRLEWVQKMIQESETFDDVIFTDESTFQVEYHARKAYRRIGEPRILRQRPKHPAKIHVWAGISKRGATQIVLFKANMTATRYTSILDASLVPFISSVYSDGHRLFQDNDPKHTSRWAQWHFEEKGINWWPTPPESPDLNPIELVWGSMKEAIRKVYKPRTLEQLEDSIKNYWRTHLTPEVCTNYIGHIQKVLPAVVAAGGQATGY